MFKLYLRFLTSSTFITPFRSISNKTRLEQSLLKHFNISKVTAFFCMSRPHTFFSCFFKIYANRSIQIKTNLEDCIYHQYAHHSLAYLVTFLTNIINHYQRAIQMTPNRKCVMNLSGHCDTYVIVSPELCFLNGDTTGR